MEEEIKLEPMYDKFGSVMQAVAYAGLGLLLVFGLLYLFGFFGATVSPEECMMHWDEPATVFWQETKGGDVDGYGWFLTNLTGMDSLSLLGVALLALCPVIALGMALFHAPRLYIFIFVVLILEFIFIVIRPLIFSGG
ncbi:MAG: hypothetical protein KGZ25_09825 [Planctomycetes bacterium]|nr:hypothetical protein [Planctomycetota bacterium]